ncbi:MAG: methyltransferase domain-containing protein [Candidatus Omnitrophota bacterium]|nr:methyltransferase domain-containing protein [Candidatus Omnitrophota bacterium]
MDKQKIRISFSKAAGSYDKNAWFPQEMARKLLSFMPASLRVPANILDIGCGTGALTVKLGKRFRKSWVIGFDLAEGMLRRARERKDGNGEIFLQADLERLPFRAGVFNIATSNLVYQRIPDLPASFKRLNRILAPRAKFYLAIATEGTLCELQSSFMSACKQINGSPPKNAYRHPEQERIARSLSSAGFRVGKIATFKKQKYYLRPLEIIKWLKSIGANYYYQPWMKGLASRRILSAMEDIYKENFSCRGKIYATFNGIIIEAEKL